MQREKIYQKYKANPILAMYDVYQWEAHPNSQFVADATLKQKIGYYEKYKKKYKINLPCLIDDDNQSFAKLYETYSPQNNKLREYTAIWVIDYDGIVIYKSAWISPGKWSKNGVDPYPPLDSLLDLILVTNIDMKDMKIGTMQDISFRFVKNTIHLQAPYFIDFSLEIFDPRGRCLLSNKGKGNTVFVLDDLHSSGRYVMKISSPKNRLILPISIFE